MQAIMSRDDDIGSRRSTDNKFLPAVVGLRGQPMLMMKNWAFWVSFAKQEV